MKLLLIGIRRNRYQVTPFVGVWIETFLRSSAFGEVDVTPFVGVWIETALSHHG